MRRMARIFKAQQNSARLAAEHRAAWRRAWRGRSVRAARQELDADALRCNIWSAGCLRRRRRPLTGVTEALDAAGLRPNPFTEVHGGVRRGSGGSMTGVWRGSDMAVAVAERRDLWVRCFGHGACGPAAFPFILRQKTARHAGTGWCGCCWRRFGPRARAGGRRTCWR